ncbi:MAG: FAD-dependent oxidoreductase, partial [Solirubrobacteraceae bacterium]|nr:FAD-dependent oxidoreductase [Solirubrobacteraceae bacterium]
GIEQVERGPSGLPGGVRLTVSPAGVLSSTTAAGPSAAPAHPDPFAVLAEPSTIDFDGVILAVPAGPAAHLIGPHAARAATTLLELRYATVAQTALAYATADLPSLPTGTGFLVPRTEGTVMTACTLLDQKWPERRSVGTDDDALRDAVVIKCSAGRVDDARADGLSDAQLVDQLHSELAALLGFGADVRPVASRVFRARAGLPQYEPGHADRIDGVVADVSRVLPAVSLAGAAYRGTSVPVCIREGRAAADAQLARLLPPA